jgi:TrmH family RNA methyltransferase
MAIHKYKKEDEKSFALGTTLTIELLLKKPQIVNVVFLHSKIVHNEAYDKIINLCAQNDIRVEPDSDNVFQTISDKDNCYAMAQFTKYQMTLSSTNHILLCNPSNGGNLGTILRSCLGFGILDVAIIVPSIDIFDPKTIRSSMGALFNMNIEFFNSISEYMNKFNDQRNLYPFMLQASKSLLDVEIVPNKKYTLMFGTEASGLPRECLNIGTPVIIKHSHAIDSLNIGNSVSIALFYFTKENFK